MFAIFETGGKQYRAEAGARLKVEKLAAEAGEKVVFGRVFLLSDGNKTSVGMPFVDGAQVKATVIKHDRGDKVRVVKFQAKKRHSSEQGHRQDYTEIEVNEVMTTGASPKPTKKSEKVTAVEAPADSEA
jgi:large subunit ribosomal protein L21